MPTVTTRGAASARGFGFGFASVSLGGTYYMGYWSYGLGTNSAETFAVTTDTLGNSYFFGDVGSNIFAAISYDRSGTINWQKRLGQSSNGHYVSAAIDSSDNSWVISDGGQVVKYNTSGTVLFQREVHTSATYSGLGYPRITVDSSSNVYSVLTTNVIVGCCCYTTYMYFFKLDSSGAIQFSKAIINSTPPTLSYIDSAGITYGNSSVYILVNGTGSYVGYNIIEFNTSGTLVSNHNLQTSTGTYGTASSIVCDSSGNIYVCGTYSNNLNFYVAKYNSSFTLQWQQVLSYRGYGTNRWKSICVDSSGNVYVVGEDTAFTSPTYYTIGQIAKYNSSGTIQWQRSMVFNTASISNSNYNELYLNSIKLDAFGDLVIGGYLQNVNSSAGTTQGTFITKIPTDGSKTGTYTIGSQSITYAASTQSTYNGTFVSSSVTGTTVTADGGVMAGASYTNYSLTRTSTVVTL